MLHDEKFTVADRKLFTIKLDTKMLFTSIRVSKSSERCTTDRNKFKTRMVVTNVDKNVFTLLMDGQYSTVLVVEARKLCVSLKS